MTTGNPELSLRDRIDLALRTTPAAGHTHTPGQERFDHHPKPGEQGHTYTHTCALCRNDTDALRKALLHVLADALRRDWARYRSRVLQEVWEAFRDADGGPFITPMNIINDLTESALAGEPSVADQLTDREQRYGFLERRAERQEQRLKEAEEKVAEFEGIVAAVTQGKRIGRPLTASDVRVAHEVTRKELAGALDVGLHLNWPELVEAARRSHDANAAWKADVDRVRQLHVPDEQGECRACHASYDPCPTTQALDETLFPRRTAALDSKETTK